MKHFLLWATTFLWSCTSIFSQEFEYITSDQDGIMPGIMYEIVFATSGDVYTCTWINQEGPGIAKFDGTQWTSISQSDGASSDHVVSIIEDSTGSLWFGTFLPDNDDRQLGRLDGSDWTFFTLLEDTPLNVETIFEDASGIIWFATNEGAFSYDGTGFTRYTADDGLVSNSLTSVTQDDDGNLWFASADLGASRFDGTNWQTFTAADGLATSELQVVFKDSTGLLWFGSGFSDTGVTSYDGATFTIYTTVDGINSNNVRDIFEDSAGNLWFAGAGVSRFDGEDWFIYNSGNGLLDDLARSVEEAPNGDIWIGSFDGISILKGGALSTQDTNATLFTPYPNPVQDILYVTNTSRTSVKDIKVFDLLGNQVGHSEKAARVNMNHLSTGVYIVSLKDDNGNTQNLKIIKE